LKALEVFITLSNLLSRFERRPKMAEELRSHHELPISSSMLPIKSRLPGEVTNLQRLQSFIETANDL
jgi:hypothetical protein